LRLAQGFNLGFPAPATVQVPKGRLKFIPTNTTGGIPRGLSSNARIVKTVSEEKPGVVFAIDLDSKNEIVGLELIGVREFSIGLLRKIAPIDTSKIDFEKARLVHAAKRDQVEA